MPRLSARPCKMIVHGMGVWRRSLAVRGASRRTLRSSVERFIKQKTRSDPNVSPHGDQELLDHVVLEAVAVDPC